MSPGPRVQIVSPRPNLLLVVIDQFRADLLDGNLAGTAELPNLRRLMAESAVFRRHYSVVAPCGPSRVSLLTGQYAMNHRAVRNGTPLRHDTPNLARELTKAGYDPLLFGYTDVTQDPRVLPPGDPRLTTYEEVLPGFTEVLRMRQETDDTAWHADLRAKGYDVPERLMDQYVPNGDRIDAPARYRAEDSDTAFLTDRFLSHMADAKPGWCAMLTYIRPHPPFVAPAPWNALHDPDGVPAPRTLLDNAPHPYIEAARAKTPASSTVQGFPDLEPTPRTVATLRALYLGLAAEVDHHLGRVLDWLDRSGQARDTLLIVTSDHGEMLGDYGLWGKGTFHDAAFHVPLIIRAPGRTPRRIDGFTESVDVTPTILDHAGLPVPDSMDGVSLLPLIDGRGGGKDHAFSEYDFGDPVHPTSIQKSLGIKVDEANLAVFRTDRYRLVHFASGLPQILHDLSGDGESRDISQLPGSAAICLDLSQRMLCHRMAHPDGTFARTMVVDGGVNTGTG